jgi:hypothetical protein
MRHALESQGFDHLTEQGGDGGGDKELLWFY